MHYSNPLAIWCKEPTPWKRPWCWERLKAGGEGDDRGCDGWMASLPRWTWVWASSGSWWWTGRSGALRSVGSQRLLTELLYSTGKVNSLHRVWVFATPRTAADGAPPSMGFSRQEHRSGLPFPSSGDLPKGRDLPFFRDQTGVSHVPGRRFSLWATREGPQHYWESDNSTLVWICWLCFSCWWISSSNLQFLIVNWFPLICYL